MPDLLSSQVISDGSPTARFSDLLITSAFFAALCLVGSLYRFLGWKHFLNIFHECPGNSNGAQKINDARDDRATQGQMNYFYFKNATEFERLFFCLSSVHNKWRGLQTEQAVKPEFGLSEDNKSQSNSILI